MTPAGRANPAYFLYHLLWNAVDWLFPPDCGGCGRAGVRWCSECQQQIERIHGPHCPCCGEPQTDDVLCQECSAHPPAFKALRSYAAFQGPIREALHRLKYQRDIALAEALSKHLIELYNDLKWNIDLVVPVPLSALRMKERGYNQSSLLGRPLAYAIERPFRPGVILRVKETRSQVGLSAAERRSNVNGGFAATRERVEGRTVLIVDDVTTTGSTVNACAQALCEAGASTVYGLTLTRAMLKTHTERQPSLTYPDWR